MSEPVSKEDETGAPGAKRKKPEHAKKKFKHTRELVKIALDAGMTQEEIGRLCRNAQQSAVSKWANGKGKASEDQIAPLLKRFGAQLNRTTARIYLVGRHVATASGYREDFDGKEWPSKLARVEGPIVFRYTFWALAQGTRAPAKVPIRRWLLHRQPGGRFVLVRQDRRVLDDERLGRWQGMVTQVRLRSSGGPAWLDCNDDAARWISQIEKPMDAAQLVSWVDDFLKDPNNGQSPHDELALPFLIRKALVEQGCEIDGVEHFIGQEAEV